ncbi:MAG: L-fucose/L-arabinose isomerase family protein [Caldilinea sp.]
MTTQLIVTLAAIARPTFDVPLAQSVADTALAQIEQAGLTVVGSRNTLIMDADSAAQVQHELGNTQSDLLILLQASFADSSMAVALAEVAAARRIPVLLWAVPDERAGERLRLNSLCGINLAGHALMLRGIAYDYLLTQAGDPAALTKIATLARAGRALRTLQGATLGVVGAHPAGFDTCAYDADDLAQLFGVRVQPVALADTLAQAAAAGAAEREHFVARVTELAPNVAELDQTAVRGTAGVYHALRTLADEAQLAGVAVRCWPEFFTELGCAACGAMSVLNEERCPASCEADVNGTLTSLLLQALAGAPAFITDLVSIEAASDSAVLWHCGLAPASMADPESTILGTIHSNRKLPLLFEFPLKPGRVTVARLHRTAGHYPGAEAQGRRDVQRNGDVGYQLVIGSGEMVRAPKSFTGTSGVLRFDRPAMAVFDTIMRMGLEHHVSIVYGDYRAELRHVARLVGLPVVELTA